MAGEPRLLRVLSWYSCGMVAIWQGMFCGNEFFVECKMCDVQSMCIVIRFVDLASTYVHASRMPNHIFEDQVFSSPNAKPCNRQSYAISSIASRTAARPRLLHRLPTRHLRPLGLRCLRQSLPCRPRNQARPLRPLRVSPHRGPGQAVHL